MIDLIRRSVMYWRSAFQETFHCVCKTPYWMWSSNLGYVIKKHGMKQLSYQGKKIQVSELCSQKRVY